MQAIRWRTWVIRGQIFQTDFSAPKTAMKSLLSLLLFIALLPCNAQAAHFDIVYARFSEKADPRESFPLAVLELAMKEANATYTVKPSSAKMERMRAVTELQRDDHPVNLVFSSMSADVEAVLRPIRIPIYRGLIGHRLFFIRGTRQADFDNVDSVDDLKKFSIGQGLGWVDVKILENAGFKVMTRPYDELFKMVDHGLVDAFPRGALEIFGEWNVHKDALPALAVEKKLLLVYRSDLIFYTNKADEELARTIEKGMLKAYDNGSYLKLYNSHPIVRQALIDSRLAKRLRFEIPNPFLSEEDKLIPARFWEGR